MKKLLICLCLAVSTGLAGKVMAEQKAIDFKFTTVAGKQIQLSDYKGKWVLVNFWAPWCPICWTEVPALNALNAEKDFVVIGVGLDYGPNEAVVAETASSHKMQFEAIVAGGSRRDQNSAFRQVGPVDFYPTSYLYSPKGEIVMFIPGQVRISKIKDFVTKLGAK